MTDPNFDSLCDLTSSPARSRIEDLVMTGATSPGRRVMRLTARSLCFCIEASTATGDKCLEQWVHKRFHCKCCFTATESPNVLHDIIMIDCVSPLKVLTTVRKCSVGPGQIYFYRHMVGGAENVMTSNILRT